LRLGAAVLAEFLKALAVGAPLVPGLRIFSLEHAFMRFFLAAILAYRPFFEAATISSS
jgi:predicted PurR-regulated permease PerM